MRWCDYILAHDGDGTGSVEDLWSAAVHDGGMVIFILGEGFDPRTLVGLKRAIEVIDTSRLQVWSIELVRRNAGPPVGADSDTVSLRNENMAELETLIGGSVLVRERFEYPEVFEKRSTGIRIARALAGHAGLAEACLVVVDVSALPAGIHFPVIGGLLQLEDQGKIGADLQVLVCENAALDEAILDEGTGPCSPMGGFRHGLNPTSTETLIWAPVLGGGQSAPISTVYRDLEPHEICPVLPFPARRPRRGDDLVVEYRELLVDTMEVEPGNFIYADERNPFDLYRTLSRLRERYREALKPLGAANLILSTHSSKLLSLGVLLAAYEHQLPVVGASPETYRLDASVDVKELASSNQLSCLWLAGSPYQ